MANSWKDVTVNQFLEIVGLEQEDLSPTEFLIERISIVTGNDYFDTDEIELNEILKQFSWIDKLPSKKSNQSFKHLSFGNFVDLEYYCTEKAPIENIDKICATIKGYEILTFECEKIQEESIFDHYTTIENYISYRTKLLDKYKGLFEEEEEEEDFEEEEEIQQTKPQPTNNKWGWQRLIYQLCNGDITKANEVTELPHIMVLNWLSMESELKLKG
jgi:hypothetical protein